MKSRVNLVLDKEDEKIVDLFSELGMPKNLSKTLLYICQVKECKSSEIEQAADLRQPEVSIAMQELQKRGWVQKRNLKTEGKGRPVHIYKTSKNLSEIVKNFEKQKINEVKKVEEDLSKLRNILESR